MMSEVRQRAWHRLVAVVAASVLVVSALVACGAAQEPTETATEEQATAPVEVRVGLLDAPASLGLVPFANKARAGETTNDFAFVYQRSITEIEYALREGMIDIAFLPPTRAAVLYNELEGGIVALDVAGQADWSLMGMGTTVKDLSSLSGHTVCMASHGSAGGFALRYLLELAGLTESVSIEYLGSDARVVAALIEDATLVGTTEGYNTAAARLKESKLHAQLDIPTLWDEMVGDGSACLGYVTVARREFVEQHPEAVEEYLAEHEASAEEFLVDPITYAPDAVERGIAPSEDICVEVAQGTQVCFERGAQMRMMLGGLLQIYADRYIPHLGGALPADDFYYLTETDRAEYEQLVQEREAQQAAKASGEADASN